MNEAFLARLDAQIAADRRASRPKTELKAITIAGTVNKPIASQASTGTAQNGLADWVGVLDTISAAKAMAQEMEARLHEHDAVRETLVADLQRAQQELQTVKTLLRDVQAHAEVRMHEMKARMDASIRAVEAQAQAKICEAAERARAADLRAEAAENWLARIEQASRDLLPETRRVAA